MGKRKILWLAWIMAVLAVVKTSMNGTEEITAFQGIAETREVIVNRENYVEIGKVQAIPGQMIKKGDLLVELQQPALAAKLNQVSHELEELKSKQTQDREGIRSQIRELHAQQRSSISEISHKIEQIQSRYQFNKEVVAGLKSFSRQTQTGKKPGSMSLEIENLKKERALTRNRFQTAIDTLEEQLACSETPDTIRQEGLKKEMALLNEEKASLFIIAPMDGIIGSIHCKSGEKLSPFQPILTLHTHAPSYVRGYIHENIHNQATIGEWVQVMAMTGESRMIEGEIVGVGSRIVAYPTRLKKRPEMQLWGREVEIRLPESNPFLLGEKVMIRTEDHGEPTVLDNSIAAIKRWVETLSDKLDPAFKSESVARINPVDGLKELTPVSSMKSIKTLGALNPIN